MSTHRRKPAGTPSGGQFASGPRARLDVALDDEYVLTDADRVSVAEQTMERGGFAGRRWHIPRLHRDDPARPEAERPVHEFVHQVLAGHGYPHPEQIRVMPCHWDLRQPGSGRAVTDCYNFIGLAGTDTSDLELLHECGHIVTGPGHGHGREFRKVAADLYGTYLGPEAAEVFESIANVE